MGFLSEIKNKLKKMTSDSQIEFKEEKLNKILDEEIKNFFPEDGQWDALCFDRPEEINCAYLPCHLRDNSWMSKLMERKLSFKGIKINSEYIEKFMNNSKTFEELRHDYELKIVDWQIEWTQRRDDWIKIYEFQDEKETLFCDDADKKFRNEVVEILISIGMDREVIEEGLEKYSKLWRDYCMKLSFLHRYDPEFFVESTHYDNYNHEKNWMKMRNYQYYQEHKESVDKYGKISDGMLMSKEEAKKLERILKKQNKKRSLYLKSKEISKSEENDFNDYPHCYLQK